MIAAVAGRARPFTPSDPMPFGKHKGIPANHVAKDYLTWCLREHGYCDPNCDRFWPEFRAALESMCGPVPSLGSKPYTPTNGNGYHQAQPTRVVVTAASSAPIRAALKATYRKLSVQYHPDRGGSVETMTAVNLFYRAAIAALDEQEQKP